MNKLTLRPSGEVVEIEEGKNILQALREKDIYLKSSCGGHATCTDCVIKVVSGEDSLTPPPFNELKLLGNVFHITKERLACQTCLTGNATIDISKHDKDADEARMKNKASTFSKQKQVTRVRKESDVKEIQDKRQMEKLERNKNDGTWVKHWDKKGSDEADPNIAPKPKRMDGNRRPKLFSTDGLENMVNSEKGPRKDFKKDLKKDHNQDFKKPIADKNRDVDQVDAVKAKYADDKSSNHQNQEFKSFRNKDKK